VSEKAIKSEVADGTSSPPVDAQSEFYSRLARASFGPDIGITANICISCGAVRQPNGEMPCDH
jgi:hypothetical protein